MSLHWTDKRSATANVGEELARRGWTLLGYKPNQSDSMTDYYSPASWEGIATNDAYPGVVVVVNASKHKSGKKEVRINHVPGESCPACSRTGIEPNALTYEQALENPNEAHETRRHQSMGYRMVTFGGKSPVNRNLYHEDGSPKCLDCYGRGHSMRQEEEVLFIWPTFSETLKGRFWHVEYQGQRIESGTGFKECAAWGDPGIRAAKGVCDQIEAAARRTIKSTIPAEASVAEGVTLVTTATGGGITVQVEHDETKGWSYLKLLPRVERAQYDAFAERFGVKWHRMRRQPVIYRLVGADELAAFFGPTPQDEQHEESTAEFVEAAPETPVEPLAVEALPPQSPGAVALASEPQNTPITLIITPLFQPEHAVQLTLF
jgi:hypothetical protein